MDKLSDFKSGKYEKPVTYAVKHKDLKTRMESRSGGIFTALSDRVLAEGGIVYGCILDENFTAAHFRAERSEERNRMRGSKYIQSEMREVFVALKEDLEKGKKVLFSGTSCQAAGLHGYLGKEYENLLCVDIVCHGVPSPMVWKDYLKWQEKKNGSKVRKADFRNKKDHGWKAHVETLTFENGKCLDSRVFATLFYSHMFLRPCCYRCPYKSVIHPGDITIADYWGIDEAAPGFNDNKGVSLVLINNYMGQEAFDSIRQEIEAVQTRIEDSMQPPLRAPYHEPEKRAQVWDQYMTKGFVYIAKRCGGYGAAAFFKKKMKRLKKRLYDRLGK